jgi:hypothetical protein
MAGTGRSQRRVSYVHGQIIAGEACTKGMPGWCHGGCPVAVRPPSPPARSLSPQLRPARSWDLISRTGTLRAGDECSRDSRGARHGRSVVGHGMAHPRIRVSARPAPGRRRPPVCARVRFPLLTIDRGSMFCWFGFGGRARLVPDRPRCRTPLIVVGYGPEGVGVGEGRGVSAVSVLPEARRVRGQGWCNRRALYL